MALTIASQTASTLAAVSVFHYMHVPVVVFYFVGALLFGICTLQTAKLSPLPAKWRRPALVLISLLIAGYVAEGIYYVARALDGAPWAAPQHAVIHVLGSILVWIGLVLGLGSADAPLWHPYLGAFVVELLFNATLCALGVATLQTYDRPSSVPLALGFLRVLVTVGLTVHGVFLVFRNQEEKHTDEEGQSLLNGSGDDPTAASNGAPSYGAVPRCVSDDGESDEDDDDKDIKDQQRKRLEDQGGWFGYIKGFAIFLPYLWPTNDWRTMLCLGIRVLHVLQGRVFNLLVPRQVGIITDKLSAGTRTMPWKDIGLWTLFEWLNGYGGIGVFDEVASMVIQTRAYQRVADLAFSHVLALSMDFHSNKDSGEVLKSVDQAESLNMFVEVVLFTIGPIILDLMLAVWYVTHLFGGYMTFLVLAIGIGYVGSGVWSTTWTQPLRRVYVGKARVESKTMYETVGNWPTVTLFNRAPYERGRYKDTVRAAVGAEIAWMVRTAVGTAIQEAVMTFGFAGCFILAISEIVAGRRPVGNLVALVMYFGSLMYPLYEIATSYRRIASMLVDAERLLQLLMTKPSVADQEGARELAVGDCKVEFKNVGFSYDARKPILQDVSFAIEPGQTVAFVGETGGGKSTMLKLLYRFYDVTAGSITIDRQDLRSVTLTSLREVLGIVPQDPSLFNQTILENVRYARLDATEAEIHAACQAAAIHDKIMTFPDGYKSKVGERGVKLSGGELQRVAIARVLLKNPRIAMLDEATSAVDSSTETQIQAAFRRLRAGRTTFVIAHRLSTVVEADVVLVVDHGQIIERGTHVELLAQGGKYAELWAKQTSSSVAASKDAPPAADEERGHKDDGDVLLGKTDSSAPR